MSAQEDALSTDVFDTPASIGEEDDSDEIEEAEDETEIPEDDAETLAEQDLLDGDIEEIENESEEK